MKNKGLLTLLSTVFVSLLLFHNCSKEPHNQDVKNGYLIVDVGVNIQVNDIDNRLKSVVDVNDYTVIIYTEGGDEVIAYDRASDMPDQVPLDPGNYYVIAHSDNLVAAAYDNPYYYGNSGGFSIVESQETSVTVNCELANCKVSVFYSDNVVAGFDDYATEVSNDEATLTYVKGETRAGYFKLGAISISTVLTYTKLDGSTAVKTLSGSISSPEAKKHYEIHIDATSDEGSATVNINIDETTSTEVISLSESGGGDGISYGDLLITEIMYDPANLSDAQGEWFEIYNNSTDNIDVQNLVIRKTATSAEYHTISESIELLPGEYLVLKRNEAATDVQGYVYGNINLNNTGAEIAILTYGTDGTDGSEIASVLYDSSFPNANGASLNLDPDHFDVDEAKIGANWCVATVEYNIDLGTPGQANSDCGI